MTDLLQEPQCSEPGPPESQTITELAETLADVCQRMAAIESRLARKRPDINGRRMTRRDRCPFGWRPHPAGNSTRLIQDGCEQKTIQYIIEAAQNPAMGMRAICRYLDELGLKRRGKKWAGAHGLIRAILDREGIATASDAERVVRARIAEQAKRAEVN